MVLIIFVSVNIVNSAIDKKGYFRLIYGLIVLIFILICILIVTIDLIVFTKYHTFLNFGLIFVITFFSIFYLFVIVQNFTFFNSYGTMNLAFKSIKMWLSLFLVSGTCFILELFSLSYDTLFVESVRNYLKLMDDYEKNDDENINENLLDFIDNIGKSENEKSEMAREKEKEKKKKMKKKKMN